MVENKERPGLFVGWVHNGEHSFEVIPTSMYGELLRKLMLDEGVHPGAIFISKMTMCNWIAPEFHKGCRQVWLGEFWKELNNIGSPEAYYEKPKYKEEKREPETKYGYISPDGRYFHCEYFGHSALEREIVGKLEKIDNPQEYLYEKGWLCIYHDPFGKGTYAIAMGYKKHMTDAQLKMLERLQIPYTSSGFEKYLLGDEKQ